ncbi:relaxase/mobilization nuclease domain-containing protein [Pseudohoeflea coraliihabitans]|uniref:Relaxase/mobilization nuclease domain-containing protein n=1 Tax=Pseudohoeflea coraliihabitans TaxID=2860393 RepID=A0ABS6WTI4_9HYPH|nr:relaxase/mobilization nuclease domain-containing protein [Pseudohoeflea sp. DP4N28-3]MBW3099265.1 relaxase/mobilization nuclease domain-containing protein [Pseudohoeflea sp. DP4N28-3]
MVPDIAGTGHSFKGAGAYYLHDKRQDGAALHPETAERVAWTATRNLATEDPAAAVRIMIATAQLADELKARAGVKNTGRKSNAHVYAYSLAWHPDEAGNLDRAEMLRAADESLKVLGAENRQALIVAHTDRKHPHVHVIVNRVDPENGKMLTTSNDRLKLSDWANAYERKRGQILTPKREERRQVREQFAEKAQRRQYAAEKRAEAASGDGADANPRAALKAFGDAQRAEHRQQWKDLSASNKQARAAIYELYGRQITEQVAAHKERTRPLWAQHFRQARANERAFRAREQTLRGILRNALEATASQRISEQSGKRGALAATFNNLLSARARAAAFAERQDISRQQVAHHVKALLDAEIRVIKEQRSVALTTQRWQFDKERQQLIAQQDAQREKIRAAWRSLGVERQKEQTAREQVTRRKEARRVVRRPENAPRDRRLDRRENRAAMKVQEKPAPQRQEAKPMKEPFDKAREVAPKKSAPAPATRTMFVPQAMPVPSPSGDVPKPVPRKAQQVPVMEKPAPTRMGGPVPVRQDIAKAARAPADVPRANPPKQPAPARPAGPPPSRAAKQAETLQRWTETRGSVTGSSLSKWEARATAEKTERKERSAPSRSRDRDYDRER